MKQETSQNLESFAPEVLAAFIRREIPILSERRASEVLARLRMIEAEFRLKQIRVELDRLHRATPKLHGPEHTKEWRRMMDRIDELHQEWDQVMDVAYPESAKPAVKTEGETDAR